MIVGYILAALGGLVLSAPVNLLADVLPRRSSSLEPDVADMPPDGAGPEGRPVRRYIAVAVLLGILVAYLWGREGLSPRFGVLVLYMAVFTLIGIIDIEHRLILTSVILPGFAISFLEVVLAGRLHLLDALTGYAIAQIVVLTFYLFGEVYLRFINRGRPADERVEEVAFGFGDVSLATLCGFIVGFPRVVPMLILMVLTGAALALLYLAGRAILRRGYTAYTALPYGPAILIAATMMLLWGPEMARLFGAQ